MSQLNNLTDEQLLELARKEGIEVPVEETIPVEEPTTDFSTMSDEELLSIAESEGISQPAEEVDVVSPPTTTPADTDPMSPEELRRWEADIIRVESGGRPGAVNPSGGASGLYQLKPHWQKWLQREHGINFQELLPRDDSREEFSRATRQQREIVFPLLVAQHRKEMNNIRRDIPEASRYSEKQLMTMLHHLGDPDTRRYLRGEEPRHTSRELVDSYTRKVLGDDPSPSVVDEREEDDEVGVEREETSENYVTEDDLSNIAKRHGVNPEKLRAWVAKYGGEMLRDSGKTNKEDLNKFLGLYSR